MGRSRANAPARLCRARDRGFGRPEQQQGPARFPRGEAQALAFLEVERLRDEADDNSCRTRAQGLFDGPEGLRVLLCFDDSETPGIETEGLQAMAIKPARGGEALRRGDNEGRPGLGKGHHEGREEAQSRRQV